jgi:hypothetical protein
MKKVLFLMILPFLLLGTARVSAQVRIGGSGTPHSAAVLDLNVNDEPTPSGNQGGLALPRVELTATDMKLNGVPPVNGMLVYNTGGTLATGVYVWMTNQWVKTSAGSVAYTGSTSIALDGDSFVRKALTGDVTADENSNETTIGNGKVTSVKILDNTITANDIADNAIRQAAIADGAIVNSKLGDASVDSRSLNSMGATAGQLLGFGSFGWAPVSPPTIGSLGGMRAINVVRAHGASFDLSAWTFYVVLGCTQGTGAWLHSVKSFSVGGEVRAVDGSTLCADTGQCRCVFGVF